ncbi:chorismate-binding protein [uncultured Algibacter sp.]|uniref:chorismate-binding protein n=1 Tax=uncultured Algibacter sp. TaxID=298659 RepID=UPI002632049C|nr:chorismate-binding protein [uncultured Algibacter sp.]
MTSEDFVKRIEDQYLNQLPFIAYRKPNKLKINALLQKTSELFFTNNFTEKGFVFSPFDNLEKTVLIPIEKSEDVSCSDLYNVPRRIVTSRFTSGTSEESKKHHINLVKKGVEAIKNKEFQKVVLSRREEVKLSETNPISIFKNLLDTYKSAFVYCWYHPKVGLWLGATPETLIKIEGKRFSIMALAGTQDYRGTLNVSWKDKEKQEQQFVTDFILNHLKPLVDRFKVSDVETVKAGNLVHLKTIISARLKSEVLLNEVIDGLHPTPAVCGLSRAEAKQFILNNENYNREFYTGFLGELNFETEVAPRSGWRNIENRAYAVKRNSTQLYVNLRCMQIKDKQGIIYVGGGITESSDPEVEWEETVSKSLVVRNAL